MSISTEDDAGPTGAAEFLRPLRRQNRTRTEAVIGELSEVARLSRAAALKRASAGRLTWETLVAIARAYQRDVEGAQRVLDALAQRVSPSIAMRVTAWDFLTPEERADARQEFWECNFTHCFNLRLLDVWNAAMRRRGREVSQTQAGSDGEEYESLDQVADPLDAFAAVEDEAFLRRLARSHPQIGRMIHLRMNGFADIARGLPQADRDFWREETGREGLLGDE